MGSSKEKLPEFFIYFHPDRDSEKLRIPDGFLEHVSICIPKKVILKNCFGKRWPVKVVKTEEDLFFQEGWSMLVSNCQLKGGEFMVLKYDGHCTFDILILNKSGQPVVSFTSQEETTMPTEEDDEEVEDVVFDQAENIMQKFGRRDNCSYTGYHVKNLEKGIIEFFPSDNPFFVTKRKNAMRMDLIIPHDILKERGLKFNNKIKIQDPKGNLFSGTVVMYRDRRQIITNFWKLSMFNKITKDDEVICELVPTSTNTCKLIKVQIIRPKTKANLQTSNV